MIIRNKDIKNLSAAIHKLIDGGTIDFRDHREGLWSILKNDIYTLAERQKEQTNSFRHERDSMAETIANISHQLKTPLTSMMIMADLLEDVSPDKQAEFTANIKAGLSHMEWLVTALLKMAKLDAGVIEFNRIKIQAGELLALAIEPLQILLDIKDQQVEIINDTELFCDRRWTVEALTNLLKNASESSESGSIIRVDSGVNPICQWLAVTDRGEGIPRRKMAGLFKRFEGTRNDAGYGIGLPLALAIMQGQNGDIEVDGGGRDGWGATFTLKFFK